MTSWRPDPLDPRRPRYRAIAEALAADISSGRLQAGERLPTHRDLAWSLGVTVGTISRAYAEAERLGLTVGEVGRGTFVRAPEAAAQHLMRRRPATDPELVDLGFNVPPPGLEVAELATVLGQLAQDPDCAADLTTYQPQGGRDADRAAAAAWIRRSGLPTQPERVVVTAGALHGILVTLAAVTRPGDRVLCESLSYPGLQAAAQLLGLRVDGVAMDREGLLPEAFAEALHGGTARALYCNPTLHNPTTATMSEPRRRAIAEIAEHHDVALLEDDILGLFHPHPPPPICRFAPRQGYYITSLSKTLAPGLRIGFVAAPEGAAQRLVNAVGASCWMASPVTAEIARRWLCGPAAERILEARRQEFAARRRVAEQQLAGWDYLCPPGSPHLWLRVPEPWRGQEFAAEARRHKIGIMAPEPFTVGRAPAPHAVRLCLGGARDCGELASTLARLADLLAQPQASGRSIM